MNYAALEKNIVDVIKEEQIKLGYQKETIRLYYPLVSLNRALHTSASVSEMEVLLENFGAYVQERLGKPEISRKGERFCICLPPETSAYVHENTPGNGFLYDLIAVVSEHHIHMEDILEQFGKYSDHVHVEEMDSDEFDTLIYFEDGQPDDYRYCFKEEMGHIIYHRFSPEDYQELL